MTHPGEYFAKIAHASINLYHQHGKVKLSECASELVGAGWGKSDAVLVLKALATANRFKYFADNETPHECPLSVEKISKAAEIFDVISDGISCSVGG